MSSALLTNKARTREFSLDVNWMEYDTGNPNTHCGGEIGGLCLGGFYQSYCNAIYDALDIRARLTYGPRFMNWLKGQLGLYDNEGDLPAVHVSDACMRLGYRAGSVTSKLYTYNVDTNDVELTLYASFKRTGLPANIFYGFENGAASINLHPLVSANKLSIGLNIYNVKVTSVGEPKFREAVLRYYRDYVNITYDHGRITLGPLFVMKKPLSLLEERKTCSKTQAN